MRSPALLIILFVLPVALKAQKKIELDQEAFYVTDQNWKGTTVKKAVYLLRSYKKNDTCWHWDIYHMYGPLVATREYRDQDRTTPHGKFSYYKKSGLRDSAAEYKNGLLHGDSYYFNDTGRAVIKKKYNEGLLTETINLLAEDAKRKAQYSDTLAPDEKESELEGGVSAWTRYMIKNLRYPERAIDNEIQGKVVVQFIVDKDGNAYGYEIVQSVEFSLDEESLRLIRQSPQWIPAVQKGKKVKSYKQQPILFRLR